MALAAISWLVGLVGKITACIVVMCLKSSLVVAGCLCGYSLMGGDGNLRTSKAV